MGFLLLGITCCVIDKWKTMQDWPKDISLIFIVRKVKIAI